MTDTTFPAAERISAPRQTPSPVPPLAAAPTPSPAAEAPKKRMLWTMLLAAVALAGVALVLYAWQLPPFTSAIQRTDDAYVRGQLTVISPQVAGYVVQTPVQDYQSVRQGQLLVAIDDRIYRQHVAQALAGLHTAQAALANSTQTRTSAQGSVAQMQANISGAQATLAKAQADAGRARKLFAGGWVAQAQVDVAQAALSAAQAQVAAASAQSGIAQTGVTAAVVGRGSLVGAVENAEAQLQLAQIDLDNTRVLAPRDGRLGEIGVKTGQYVTTGTQLMAVVPDRMWVIANMKETQMRNIQVGSAVELSVDALGHQSLHGHVERISPATGSEFSVIRPDNATGNFTKVAQRIPVRVSIDANQPLAARLSPGMSVVTRIDTRTGDGARGGAGPRAAGAARGVARLTPNQQIRR